MQASQAHAAVSGGAASQDCSAVPAGSRSGRFIEGSSGMGRGGVRKRRGKECRPPRSPQDRKTGKGGSPGQEAPGPC